ncbi:hypothetical protein DITRI_Ditri02bG0025900 [Diplodiscus trichospermus]
MKAVLITSLGDPEVLKLQEVEDPKIKDDEVLIKVEAAALNRGDIYQRQGFYPPPQGASPYLGLECSGIIEAVGENVLAGKSEIRLSAGETLLRNWYICIQIAKFKGAKVSVTAGVDVILDSIGAAYLQRNLDSLNIDGRPFIIGSLSGFLAELNIGAMFAERLKIQAAALRTRSLEEKAAIVSEVEKNVWPAIISGKVKPVVYKRFPLGEAAEAHRLMESSKHIGKIMLIP